MPLIAGLLVSAQATGLSLPRCRGTDEHQFVAELYLRIPDERANLCGIRLNVGLSQLAEHEPYGNTADLTV